MASLRIIAGVILLIFGRQVFWLFVAVLGFFTGMDLANQLVPESGDLAVLLVAVVVGVLGAILAYFFYHVAIAAAGFVAGGRVGTELVAALMPLSPQTIWVVFIAGGVIGAILMLLIFDWALIVISSVLGASVIVQQVSAEPTASGTLFIVLIIVGIAIQAAIMRRYAAPA